MTMRLMLLVTAVLLCSRTSLPMVSAHDIIPPEVLEYIERHPDASAEELQALLGVNDGADTKQQDQQMRMLEAVRSEQRGFWANALEFIRLGIEHILGGPDHILFVLAIALTFVTLRSLFKLVTAFTIAHSITLIIAGMQWFTLTSRVVEPVIALSIAYVAVTTVFLRRIPFFATVHSKASTIFLFGLFHGLGFAGLLTNLNVPQNKFLSSLLFFNVGIEVGQIIVLGVAIPLLLWLRGRKWHNWAISLIAIGISAIALVWFIQRIL